MIYPDYIRGPQFAEGDLVTFDFDDAELSLRLPKLPWNRDTTDVVSPQRDFRNADFTDWRQTGFGNVMKSLVKQSWKCDDDITHDDIAYCYLEVIVCELLEDIRDRQLCLNSQTFKKWLFDDFAQEKVSDSLAQNPLMPSHLNNYLAREIERPLINWIVSQYYGNGEDRPPSPIVYIPINGQFLMNISLHLKSIHYPDRQNPYSEELLHQLKLDLFDEFISFIHVEYSGATLETIQRLKKNNSN